MYKYFLYFTFITLLSFPLLGTAQQSSGTPSSIGQITEARALFENLFSRNNIGKLHVFVQQDTSSETMQPLPGQPIKDEFRFFFGNAGFLHASRTPEAISIVRGASLDYFLIRYWNKTGHEELALFQFKGLRLKKRKLLATIQCKEQQCWQQEAWILDLDGDTDLDFVTKRRAYDRDGDQSAVKTKAFVQTDNGRLRAKAKVELGAYEYAMKEMSEISLAKSGN